MSVHSRLSGDRPPIRVLIAEDMQTTYYLLRQIIEETGDFQVVGWAVDGKDVVLQSNTLKPDIITMDIQMPRQSGLEAIREIMSTQPVPIVVVSSLANDANVNIAFEALDKGALDVVGKPVSITDEGFGAYCNNLRTKLAALSEVKVVRRRSRHTIPTAQTTSTPPSLRRPDSKSIVALGASAGGPEALHTILSALPGDFCRPIVVAQHIVEGFVEGMANWLAHQCALKVKLAEHKEPLMPGTVYLAPDNRHLLVQQEGQRLFAFLEDSPPLGGFKPSINMLLQSVANSCGAAAISGILTGMGGDGAIGLRAIADRGGITFVQDKESSLIFSMPRTALDLGAAKQALPLKEIPAFLLSNCCPTGR